MNKGLFAGLLAVALHLGVMMAMAAPHLNAAPLAHAKRPSVPVLVSSAIAPARVASAPKCKGSPIVKSKPTQPRVMVCGAPRMLRTSTFQTVRVCEYQ